MLEKIEAQLILDGQANESTMDLICQEMGGDRSSQQSFMVFEIKHCGKTMYCCWAGGRMNEDLKPEFTLIGQAATEALLNLPCGSTQLIIQHMSLGSTPLLVKLKRLLDKLEEGAKVCFLGDVQGELDGQIQFVFDIVGFKHLRH